MWSWQKLSMGNKSSNGTGSSSTPVGRKLSDSVYVLSEPPQPQVEVVFIHGLQLKGFQGAYWETWTTRESSPVCWPSTWLKQSMPTARILSLSYDSRAVKSRAAGEDIDMYSIGEALLTEMRMAEIGQMMNVPVVLVCHSLGGLVAKQIVVHAWRNRGSSQQRAAEECKSFLENMAGVFFYATPHFGSELADFADTVLKLVPIEKTRMVDYLMVLDKQTALLNNDFEKLHRQEYNERWKFQVIGELLKTKWGTFHRMVVPEASARLVGVPFMSVHENHVNVCKPQTPTDISFSLLVNFIRDAVGTQLQHGVIEDLA